jgi:hypothetical protein|tara:strand:+ start:4831 stop:5016 length:186 start_codon:yes stop_codon:yes gene_type:complete
MMKKDLLKLKETLNHSDNKLQHLPAINRYIQLFYDKWKEESNPHIEEISEYHTTLLEKLTK